VRLASAVSFMFLALIFFICFYYMLYMMFYALQVIRPPEEVCEAPLLCSIYQSVREGVKRIFVFTAVMLLLAFIVSLVVLWIEQRLWENSRCCK